MFIVKEAGEPWGGACGEGHRALAPPAAASMCLATWKLPKASPLGFLWRLRCISEANRLGGEPSKACLFSPSCPLCGCGAVPSGMRGVL